jgi:DNA-binding IclR family transcriptional regulator
MTLPDWLPAEPWAAYLEMRKKIRKPMTEYAMKLLINKLERIRVEGHNAIEALDHATLCCYLSAWPVPKRIVNGNTSVTKIIDHNTDRYAEQAREKIRETQQRIAELHKTRH